MNVRVCFAKYGCVKFIGHLDVMRFFQKAIRRAELDIVYSKGFHPHQIMSFASPLSVGVTSDCEYMDLNLTGLLSAEEVVNRLNAVMPEGFFIRSCRLLPPQENGERKETAMSLITVADYLVSLKDEANEQLLPEEFQAELNSFFMQKEIFTEKTVKKSGRKEMIDLKKLVYEYGNSAEQLKKIGRTGKNVISEEGSFFEEPHETFADKFKNNVTAVFRLPAGSEENVKPELILQTLFTFAGREYNVTSFQIHRLNLYTGELGNLSAI